jgi:hypothetical protein
MKSSLLILIAYGFFGTSIFTHIVEKNLIIKNKRYTFLYPGYYFLLAD